MTANAKDAPVVIDEAQRSRSLALAIKRIVDERRQKGQFLLTGSSNVFAAAHVTDSLAGRVSTLMLYPLSSAEVFRCGPVKILDWAAENPSLAALADIPSAGRQACIDLIVQGGYPEIRDLPDRPRNKRYRDAVDALVDRDVAAALRGFSSTSFGPAGDQAALGHLLETYVHNELVKNLPYQIRDWRLWHWRNQEGREVDLLAESDRMLVAMEVKASSTVNADDVKNLLWFKTQGPGRTWQVVGILFYLGDRPLALGDNIFGLPLSSFQAWRF